MTRSSKRIGLGVKAVGEFATELGTKLRKLGLSYHVWPVDTADLGRRFVKAGVNSVTTNKPAKMREFLKDHTSDRQIKRLAR